VSNVATSGGILAHIRHAEQWLRKARGDYQRGDVPQAVLRLLLAEAEIRRARESEAATDAAPRRRAWTPSWAALGTVVAAGVMAVAYAAYVLTRPLVPAPVATAPSIVRAVPVGERLAGPALRFESGQVLPFVGVPAGVRPSWRTGSEGMGGFDGGPLLNGADGPTPVTFR
jgi:hypothetical protein